jgi:hypothetical protein
VISYRDGYHLMYRNSILLLIKNFSQHTMLSLGSENEIYNPRTVTIETMITYKCFTFFFKLISIEYVVNDSPNHILIEMLT